AGAGQGLDEAARGVGEGGPAGHDDLRVAVAARGIQPERALVALAVGDVERGVVVEVGLQVEDVVGQVVRQQGVRAVDEQLDGGGGRTGDLERRVDEEGVAGDRAAPGHVLPLNVQEAAGIDTNRAPVDHSAAQVAAAAGPGHRL